MPSVARKLLMAGRGGLNLTHSEPLDRFATRYGDAQPTVSRWVQAFSPADLTRWVEGLGQPTFVGSSGRVFPQGDEGLAFAAGLADTVGDAGCAYPNPLSLDRDGKTGRWRSTRPRASSWNGRTPWFWPWAAPAGRVWDRMAPGPLGWNAPTTPFRPANVGFDLSWSPLFRKRFAGQPLKGIALSHGDQSVRGEAMIARYGLEGGAVYALSAPLRDAVQTAGHAEVRIDLKPDIDIDRLTTRLDRPRGKASLSNHLRKTAGLDSAARSPCCTKPGRRPLNLAPWPSGSRPCP